MNVAPNEYRGKKQTRMERPTAAYQIPDQWISNSVQKAHRMAGATDFEGMLERKSDGLTDFKGTPESIFDGAIDFEGTRHIRRSYRLV